MDALLGTVALEPNRWGTLDRSRRPVTTLSAWLPGIAEAGFDGIEVWEGHLTGADPDEAAAVLAGPVPVTILNSYVGFDDADPARRDAVASLVARAGSKGVKFNVGNDLAQQDAYAERIAAWSDSMPPGVTLLCECHEDISIAEDPAVAAAIFAAAGPPERVGAIVHTHEEPDLIKARFDAYGERITHVHVNFLAGGGAPKLADERDRLEARAELLASLGFGGSWTIEFVHGALTDGDEPERLLAQAKDDLTVLREVLG